MDGNEFYILTKEKYKNLFRLNYRELKKVNAKNFDDNNTIVVLTEGI